MTKDEQRVAIAEWMGWTDIEHGEATASPPYDLVGIDSRCVMSHTLMDKHRDEVTRPWKKYVPNYPEDLNAMHEAEKKIYGIEKWLVYEAELYKPNNSSIAASADEKSEALCRTLWPERFDK